MLFIFVLFLKQLERTFIESALEMCSAKENALLQNLQQSHEKCKVENDERCQDGESPTSHMTILCYDCHSCSI